MAASGLVRASTASRAVAIGSALTVASSKYGDNPGFTQALLAAEVPFVLALKPRKGTWAPAQAAHTPVEAAGELGWRGPSRPGRWRRVVRRFRDGHAEAWWAADARLGGWGPDRRLRLVVATTDPGRLPGRSSWYLLTSLPRPAGRRARQASLAEVIGLYGLRNWAEQGDKQGQGRAWLGRLPGPKRPGDPSALGAGRLRVLVLLAGLPRRAACPT
jgi:hypothetical protein